MATVVATHPMLRAVLQAHGIDLCCGGGLTLEEAAQARGVSLEVLLSALEAALPAAPASAGSGPTDEAPASRPAIGPADTIRNVLSRYPQTVAVFEKHGLMGCGGTAGPDERIDLFAAVHRIDASALIQALNDALAVDPPSAPTRTAQESASVYPPFLWAALLATLTLGATFGAANVLWIHWSLGRIPSNHQWVHAGVQIWGFVFLFIAGVGYHVIPRFLGAELASPVMARSTLWTGVAALVAMTYGRFGPLLPRTAGATLVGALLELVTVAGFAGVLLATARRARPAPDRFHRFLVLGTLWWLVAAVLLVAGGIQAMARGDAEIAAEWNEAVYAAALFGGTLAWIEGVFLRVGPVFLDAGEVDDRLAGLALDLGATGALLMTAGGVLLGRPAAHSFTSVGLLVLAGNALTYVMAVRPFSARPGHLAAMDPAFGTIIRLAFGGLMLFALLASSFGLMDIAGHTPHRLIFDGARHAFTLGFVTLMIFGMAGRIVPIFGGATLRWPAAREHGAHLIALGVVLRQAQVIVGLGGPGWWMTISGISGIIGAAGVTLASASILGTLARRDRRVLDGQAASDAAGQLHATGQDVRIDAGTIVGRLIGAHPEALPILIEAGFTPLANPLLRRTLAHAVTLSQACRMHAIDVNAVLTRIRSACTHGPATAATAVDPSTAAIVSIPAAPEAPITPGASAPPAAPTAANIGIPSGGSPSPTDLPATARSTSAWVAKAPVAVSSPAGWTPRLSGTSDASWTDEVVAPPLWSLGAGRDEATLTRVLRSVIDPELGIDVVELGLIYGIESAPDGSIRVRMTLTTPGCPHGQRLAHLVREVLVALPGVGQVDVEVVFDPPWSLEKMSAAARSRLGLPPVGEPAQGAGR